MGGILSRGTNGVEEMEITANSAYIYPPKTGSYFGSHFFMGGKKFDMIQPESYLFGDNADLNYLGPRPYNFPYQAPNGDQPVRALKCLVNIRKDSLRLIRVPNSQPKPEYMISNPDPSIEEETPHLYNMEFTFDADCPCSIKIFYNASEEMVNRAVVYTSQSDCSETAHFYAGSNQQFCVPSHIISPHLLLKEKLNSGWDQLNIPIAIQISADCGPDFAGHSHITYAMFEKGSDNGYSIKLTKQKQAINGVCYLIQEIYGIENKHSTNHSGGDAGVTDEESSDDDDDASECVVCLSDTRDTLILPCKHLCLCSSCANQLRFQQSGCPICRQSFRALLQIRAVRKKSPLSAGGEVDPETLSVDSEAGEDLPLDIRVPYGYEVVPLISAINGPVSEASLISPHLDEQGTRTRSSISTSSNNSTRRSHRRKNKVVMDIENETVTAVIGSGEQGSERKKSRSKRRSAKKVASLDKRVVEPLCNEQSQNYSKITDTTMPDSPSSESILNPDERIVVSSHCVEEVVEADVDQQVVVDRPGSITTPVEELTNSATSASELIKTNEAEQDIEILPVDFGPETVSQMEIDHRV